MAGAAVGLDVLEAFDVAGNLALEVSLYLVGFDQFADLVLLVDRELLGGDGSAHFGLLEDELGAGPADAVNGGKREFQALVIGDCYAEYSHGLV